MTLIDSYFAVSIHTRRVLQYATRDNEKSIFVFAPSSTSGGLRSGPEMETAVVRYVIPSEQLATADLVHRHDGKDGVKTTRGAHIPIYLRHSELIDAYAVRLEQVPIALLKIFRDATGNVFFGNEQLQVGCTIRASEYVTSLGSLLQGYADLAQTQARDRSGHGRRDGAPRTCLRCRSAKVPCSL